MGLGCMSPDADKNPPVNYYGSTSAHPESELEVLAY
jgi:hypothetical protein